MKKILKIARLELSVLFYSPVAWIVLAIFMIQCGIAFFGYLNDIRTTVSLGYQTNSITSQLFANPSGLFAGIQGTLYLYIPILTMSLMSRETSSGSIKLLLSSPVKLRQIILGKYLAIAVFSFTLIAILGLFGLMGAFFIKNADIGMIFSGLLGLYLLVCTYAAIGLFMSCLTIYPVVAAISTLAIFAVLRFVGSIGQGIDFVRDLTYFLSISGRTEKMIAGMITTKDLFYYLIIIASFLLLCMLRLKSERELKPWTLKAGRYMALAIGALLLGYITSRPALTGYLDVTNAKSLTLTSKSQEIARHLDGPVKVTTYANLFAPNLNALLPESRNSDLAKIEQYKRFIPGLATNYVYYYQPTVDTNYRIYKYSPNTKGVTNIDKIAEKTVVNMDIDGNLFLPPAQIDKLINLEPEGYMPVRKLEYKGKSAFIRLYLEASPDAGETEFMAAFKRLLIKAPKLAFITGNNERLTDSKGDRDYRIISAMKTRRTSLVNQGFDVETINLNSQDIPADIDVVVLGDPTVPFTDLQQKKLSTYLDKGGNMLITGEPGRQSILNPLLKGLGLELKSGILLSADKTQTPGFISAQLSPNALGLDSNFDRLQKAQVPVAIQGAGSVTKVSGSAFNIRPLLLSSPDGWNKNIKITLANPEKKEDAPKRLPEKSVLAATPVIVNKPVSSAAAVSTVAVASVADKKAEQVSSQKTVTQTPVKSLPGAEESSAGSASTSAVTVNAMTEANPAKAQGAIDLTGANLNYEEAQGDQKGPFPIAVSLSRRIGGKEQRIIVSGDADFMSNAELSRIKRGENQYYTFGLFRWLSGGEFPIDVTRPAPNDLDLYVTRGQITIFTWLCKAIAPAIIAIIGAIILFKRRRK